MLLRNRFYLSDIAKLKAKGNGEKPPVRAGWIKPLWILPRAWCVTTSLQAKGVPRHKTLALVKLHLNRLAPFADCGVYACRSGDWVHLWFWENHRVRELCMLHGLDFEHLQLAPESVCFPKRQDGAVLYQCQQGGEAQLWHQGLLIDSSWWPERIDADAWQAWLPSAAASTGARVQLASWPESMPAYVTPGESLAANAGARLSEPWGRNLFGAQWWAGIKEIRADMLLWAAAGLLAGFAAFLCAQSLMLRNVQHETEQKIAALSRRVEPLNDFRSKALKAQQWTTKLASLRSPDNIKEILHNLQPVLQQQEAAIREFEYLDGEVRLTLVPINTELNIVAVIQELESLSRFSTIRLLPDSDSRVIRVSAKVQRLASPVREVRVLGQVQKNIETQKPDSYLTRSGKREKGE